MVNVTNNLIISLKAMSVVDAEQASGGKVFFCSFPTQRAGPQRIWRVARSPSSSSRPQSALPLHNASAHVTGMSRQRRSRVGVLHRFDRPCVLAASGRAPGRSVASQACFLRHPDRSCSHFTVQVHLVGPCRHVHSPLCKGRAGDK